MSTEIATPDTDTLILEDFDLDHDHLWQVVLFDDDDHTYEYVIRMLMEIFQHPEDLAYRMTCEVDSMGRVIVDVCNKEDAEKKCKRILSYGPDPLLSRSLGSMSAQAEPIA
ncbi:MAG: ATP-dependent Clp protease adaptor ClpS [Verrucomicrobiota bacterium]